MKDLKYIEGLGGIDADTDTLLFECFQNHEAYNAVLDFKKFIILGRKGTGKTAIYKKILKDTDDTTFAIGHTFLDYPWHHHDKQVKIGVPDFDKYTHSWKYLIYLTLSKILLNKDRSLPFDQQSSESIEILKSFVTDTYGNSDPDISKIFTPTRSLKLSPHFKLDFGVFKGEVAPEMVSIQDLPVIIQDVNLNLNQHIINCLHPDHKYFIVFDQLDLGFDPSSPNYYNRLIGLLLACRDINNAAKEKGKMLGICVFLRDDIYNALKFEDKNKMTVAHSTFIEWDLRGGHTLKELMEKRFTQVLSEDGKHVFWSDVFDENKLMTGKQSKYNYITDRTFLRPRDIIQFCNEIIEQYKKDQDNKGKFNNKEIYKAKEEYSGYFLAELDDEIHKHVPEYEELLEIFKSIGYYQFEFDEFDKKYRLLKGSTATTVDAIKALRSLYDFSIIGIYKAGGSGFGGAEFVFKYKQQKTRFDENSKFFRVHIGLLETLQLKRSSAPRRLSNF